MTLSKIPLRKRIALKLHKKYKRNESIIHQLNYIFLECTLKCNLSCIHCGSDCKKDSLVKDIPAKDFLKAIEQIIPIVNPNKTMVVFAGGEALLRNDIENMGAQLYDWGFPWGIVTNGMLLNKQRLNSLINSGLRSITVSLDGLEASHNWLRNHPNSFKKAFEAIKLLTSTKGLRYDVVTCVNPCNFEELGQIRDLLIGIGVKEWRVFTIFPVGRAKEELRLQLSAVQFVEVFDFIRQTRTEKKIKLSYGCEGFLGNYEGEVRDSFFFCRAGINIASILADGSISSCPDMRDNFIQGNIYNDNFADVWQNKYKKYRDRSWTKTGICSDCEVYKYCEGSGMHLRNEKTGELLMCHYKKLQEA
jgi:radical SAM enzyme (rSAM/lipoprotein system)